MAISRRVSDATRYETRRDANEEVRILREDGWPKAKAIKMQVDWDTQAWVILLKGEIDSNPIWFIN